MSEIHGSRVKMLMINNALTTSSRIVWISTPYIWWSIYILIFYGLVTMFLTCLDFVKFNWYWKVCNFQITSFKPWKHKVAERVLASKLMYSTVGPVPFNCPYHVWNLTCQDQTLAFQKKPWLEIDHLSKVTHFDQVSCLSLLYWFRLSTIFS